MTLTHPKIIGISGKAQHGKDTLAGILHDLYGYEKIAFADSLRACVLALDPFIDEEVRVHHALEELGYEETKKEYPEYRRLLQAMGTEVGRNILGENVWVDAAFRNAPEGKLLVVSDVRFPNEYQAIKARGGAVWRVHRPGIPPVIDHPSEWALDEYSFDAIFVNEGSVKDLSEKVMQNLDGPLRYNAASLSRDEDLTRSFLAGRWEQ